MNQTQDFATESWPIGRPKPYPKNARKWSQKAIEKVAASIREFGWRQPLVCDAEDVIVIGHLRLAAAQFLGLEQVPVHVAHDLSPAKVRALRLADNRLHEEAQWDEGLLREDMLDLKGLDLDLSLTGFSSRELDALTLTPSEKADECPEVPKWAVTKPGDLWLMGEHRLLCGDCTNVECVAALRGDRQPALMVTDPPYGIELDSEWRDRALKNSAGAAEPSYMRFTSANRHHQSSGDTIADWSHAFELVPSIQVAYVWHASVFTSDVVRGLLRIGFLYPQQIIWKKPSPVMTRTHYWFQHEPCWYVRKKNAPWFGRGGAADSTIWEASSPKFIMASSKDPADVKQDHPTQKPVELMRKSILNHAKDGALVYEPFGGSGSTLIAAQDTGRVCLAIELEPKYCDVIVQRWQNFTGLEAKLEGHGATFAQIKDGRLREWEDAIKEEVLNVQT